MGSPARVLAEAIAEEGRRLVVLLSSPGRLEALQAEDTERKQSIASSSVRTPAVAA